VEELHGSASETGAARPSAPVAIADVSAGMYAFSSILAALYDRERTGQGRTIETVMLDCLAEWMSAPASFWMYGGIKLERAGWRHNIIVPYGPYRCGDGQHLAGVRLRDRRLPRGPDRLAAPPDP
jgi:crotonobetainyl-CoA:carnitine CoA-transferase CaiB-like acyl-CoA transferase